MGSLAGKLLREDDLKEMYSTENGSPGLPPSVLAGDWMLQFYDDVSHGEAVGRILYDLHWNVAMMIERDFVSRAWIAVALPAVQKYLAEAVMPGWVVDRLSRGNICK